MPRDVFFYYYNTPDSLTYLPLAEKSQDTTNVLNNVYADKLYPLYNEKDEQVGYITWSGNSMTFSQDTNHNLVREIATIYMSKNKLDSKNVTGSVSYFTSFIEDNTPWFGTEKKPISSLCISASGSYNIEKIKYITEEPINTKKGKGKVTIFYDN